MPRLSIAYTICCVNLLLLITHTASAPLSLYSFQASSGMSGLPIVRVLCMTALGSVCNTESTRGFPKVCSWFGAVHKMRQRTFRARMTARQGPIPEPVATSTTERKSGAIRSTPQAGIPRTQMCVGARLMVRFVKSPALLTTREKPLPLALVIVAKPCQSRRGLSAIGRSAHHCA